METMRLTRNVIVGGIILSLLVGYIVPSSQASIKTYPKDFVWEDTFDNNIDLVLENCEVKTGEIVLKKDSKTPQYDFAEPANHAFHFYKWYLFNPFLSPERHIAKESDPLGGRDIDNISKPGDKSYTSRSSAILQRVIVHHFRFYIDFDEESLEKLYVNWSGKASLNAKINFYFWNSSRLQHWQYIGWRSYTSKDVYINFSLDGKDVENAIDSNKYLDISVVAYYPLQLRPCTLWTDYIGVYTPTILGYSTKNANATTNKPIEPKKISNISSFYWELLAWDDYQAAGAEVRYHVLYINETGADVEVEDSVLPGNKQGFTTSPVSLRNLSNYEYHDTYTKLKIKANLSTDSSLISPRIFNWAVTWQNGTKWQDSFTTYYRIDERSKITKYNNETIMISQIQDEWPVFGFNSENTRASNSKGALTNNLYWYSKEYYVGGGFRNPVIGNGMVYIFSNRQSLLRYKAALPTGTAEGKPFSNQTFKKITYTLANSPAVTDDFIIIATGTQGDKGHENHIYAYNIDNLTQQWDFSQPKNICYDASPIVVGNTIFISSWGGDNGDYLIPTNRYQNNKFIALNLDDGKQIWNYTLPGPGLSTAAVSDDVVIVVCNSTENDSVFAFNLNGQKIWSKRAGAIGHASPVISGSTLFVTCTQEDNNKKAYTKIVALDLNNGEYLWNTTVSGLLSASFTPDSTPAVYNNVLYVASPDGTVIALETTNGSKIWSKSIYTMSSSKVLRSSPAYADNMIYIGTPAGKIVALNASTGSVVWEDTTFPDVSGKPAMIIGSPIVSNGLIYVADENGYLYSYGKFVASTNKLTGSITSVPIQLPESYWWGNFYADVSYNGSISSIKFKLLDENGNVLSNDLKNKSSLSLVGQALGRVVRLQADFSSDNISKDNPKLHKWSITLTTDTVKPYLDSTTFTPDSQGWLPEVVPSFSIKAKDNNTGLRVTTAKYTLGYTLNNVSQWITRPAVCSGQNGTTSLETITMNISSLSFYDNITSLKSIMFNISDMAGNTQSKTVTFKQDLQKPTSFIKSLSMKKRYTSSFIVINATANDTGILNVDASGIRYVELYYRYSEDSNFSDAGDWILFSNSTKSVLTWNFNFSDDPRQTGGYYELCTIATDNAGHIENFPTLGDVWFLYDWQEPYRPDVSGETLWFKERPQLSVRFEDDYRLDTIQYHPNFETTWTTLASDVNESIYDTDTVGNQWTLKQDYWDQMIEGEIYYLYFKINDTLNNTLEVTDNTYAIKIRKDVSLPIVSIDVPSLETEWSWEYNFTIEGFGDDQYGSGIKEALLYYRFSEDDSNWTNWIPYGDSLDALPYNWEFNANEGDGYYEVKIDVTDYAGNTAESEPYRIIIASFPTTLALVLVGLLVAFLLISTIIFYTWRKKKTT